MAFKLHLFSNGIICNVWMGKAEKKLCLKSGYCFKSFKYFCSNWVLKKATKIFKN